MLLIAISLRYRCRIFLQFSPGTVNGHTSDKTLEAFEFPGTTGRRTPRRCSTGQLCASISRGTGPTRRMAHNTHNWRGVVPSERSRIPQKALLGV